MKTHESFHPTALLVKLGAALGLALVCSTGAAQELMPKLDVPYVPTPQAVVEQMLEVAKVGKNDVVYDLGCGDGRIVVTAASERGARGVGIDINPQRIAEARANAKSAGVQDKVDFKVGDLYAADVSPATVVTLYLLPDVNRKLRPQLWRQLRVGTRVVSHAFDMGSEWPPERIEKAAGRTIYYWTITEANKKQQALADSRMQTRQMESASTGVAGAPAAVR